MSLSNAPFAPLKCLPFRALLLVAPRVRVAVGVVDLCALALIGTTTSVVLERGQICRQSTLLTEDPTPRLHFVLGRDVDGKSDAIKHTRANCAAPFFGDFLVIDKILLQPFALDVSGSAMLLQIWIVLLAQAFAVKGVVITR